MTVLDDNEIQKLVDCDSLISDFDPSSLQGASYDLQLGRQYVKFGEIRTLTDDNPTLMLFPGEFAILS